MTTIEVDDLQAIGAMVVEENAFLFESPSSYSAGVLAIVEALEERSSQTNQVTGSIEGRQTADG